MREVAWQEVNKKDQIVSKRKEFKTEAALERFIEKLYKKDNFLGVIGVR